MSVHSLATGRRVLLAVIALAVILLSGCALGQADRATNVLDSSATLNGYVGGSRDTNIEYWFQYGPSTAYGSETQHRSLAISDRDPHPVSEPVGGLSPSTTYHFRLCATDPGDQLGGAPICVGDQSFATTGCPGLGGFGAGNWPPACWRPYAGSGPATSPFNRPIPANPRLDPASAGIVSNLAAPGNLTAGTADTADDWSHPLYYAGRDDPLFTIHCTEPWGDCELEGMQVRIPERARPAGGGDAHMAVLDQYSGEAWEYDFWQVRSKPSGGGRLDISWGGRTKATGDGLGSNATAAHFGLAAGVIRAQELEAGQIDHALFVTVGCSNGRSVYPAGSGAGAICSDSTQRSNAPAMGARFQLAMSNEQIDALPVPGWKKTILRALAKYGGYFGDTGGPGFGFQFESGSTYTSFGYEDRMVKFARDNQVPTWNGVYVFNMRDGVDWGRYLRVLDPCTALGTC
jgi:hypothetical protein